MKDYFECGSVEFIDVKSPENHTFWIRLAIGFALLMLIIGTLLLCSVPPVSRDALTHHLAVPKLYIAQGRMLELPEIIPSYFPMNLDLLYLIPLLWGNDIIPKYIHMAFGLFTAFFILRYLHNRLNRTYGFLGVLFFLSLPIIIQLSITVYVDLGLIFFSTAALAYLLDWRKGGWRGRYLLLAAACCGLALGTKYNGLVVFMLLALAVPIIAGRKQAASGERVGAFGELRRVVRPALIFVAVALLVYAPWALRNYVWTGNPFFPLFDTFFNSHSPYIENRLNPLVMRRLGYGESLWETLLVPIRIFFQGQDNVPALFDGQLNPSLLLLSIIGFFPSKNQSQGLQFEKVIWGGFALLFIIIVFFTRDMRIRYIAPAIPPLVILSMFGVRNLYSAICGVGNYSMRRGLQFVTALVIAFFISQNAFYLFHKWQSVRPLDYLGGKVDRAAYITRHRPEYDVIRYANLTLGVTDRILCVFMGNRHYYFDIQPLFIEWPQFKQLVGQVPDAERLAERIGQKGISHVVIGMEGLTQWSRQSLTIAEQTKVREWLQNHLEIIRERNGYALFRLRKEAVNETK